METQIIDLKNPAENPQGLRQIADALKNGQLAAIPTETVYGLAANAFDENAVRRIFEVKGRPQDNPLIVHVCRAEDILSLVTEMPDTALCLADAFWPGPLTLVLKRSGKIPAVVSAGLDTVAIRLPSHPAARAVISAAGVPLAAPSANLSGSPSPTSVRHCIMDLNGKIPFIADGGDCEVGVESTVVSLTGEKPILLRPGGITPEQLEKVLGESIMLDSAVKGKFDGSKASSPGMKYKHYSPKCKVTLLCGDDEGYINYVNSYSGEKVFALCYDEDASHINKPYISLGDKGDASLQAHRLFAALRKFDELDASQVLARCPGQTGVSLAVYNRLVRSAGFDIMYV